MVNLPSLSKKYAHCVCVSAQVTLLVLPVQDAVVKDPHKSGLVLVPEHPLAVGMAIGILVPAVPAIPELG